MKSFIIKVSIAVLPILLFAGQQVSRACTGITLRAADGSVVLARTIEWGDSELPSRYVIVPRGMDFVSYTPTGKNGMKFEAKYGFAGISIVQDEFVVEGLNEAGLSAGLFYFPGYGKYPEYKRENNSKTIADLQLVSWMLSRFSTVDEVAAAVRKINVVAIEGSSTVHWRIGDASGRQIVLEIIDGVPQIYENTVGVLTNAPGFMWHVTNLNNYVNLYPGGAKTFSVGGTLVHPFGAGSGMLGIPGDVTPPSRFVRAFFYRMSAPEQKTGRECVMQSFHILNNFDIPVGVEHAAGQAPDIPSATQWTSSTDLTNLKLYYKTMHNGTIRCIDLKSIDFSSINFVSEPLDEVKEEPVLMLKIS